MLGLRLGEMAPKGEICFSSNVEIRISQQFSLLWTIIEMLSSYEIGSPVAAQSTSPACPGPRALPTGPAAQFPALPGRPETLLVLCTVSLAPAANISLIYI